MYRVYKTGGQPFPWSIQIAHLSTRQETGRVQRVIQSNFYLINIFYCCLSYSCPELLQTTYFLLLLHIKSIDQQNKGQFYCAGGRRFIVKKQQAANCICHKVNESLFAIGIQSQSRYGFD